MRNDNFEGLKIKKCNDLEEFLFGKEVTPSGIEKQRLKCTLSDLEIYDLPPGFSEILDSIITIPSVTTDNIGDIRIRTILKLEPVSAALGFK